MALNNTALKELRKEKKLTQTELASKLNISQKSYSNWESGKAEPTLDNIIKLANILDTTTDELLGRQVDFGDKVIFNITNYDLSNIKNFSERELYDLKSTIVLELLDDSIDTQIVKNKLTTNNKLNKDQEFILDTILTEAKIFADEVLAFEKFRKSKRKFKWPWQKD
ncbi:helix-turn-helix domain-containing protein [Streptococcus suis]|uniref:helix-turn-helix domain-containing protein n=1 Tax=Streptococcus suis TaxID=1307 RepID=UPI0011478BB8|nr:helix-turn-helix domain-containing protein [Streptococcus suis]MCK4004023.1 helix-turn-helix domain-containing protein [Streptococcus suis]NQP00079.1 helix-turn-helix domain-containing protein [Streptococcus suis]TQE84460.1 helix-turn-helix domain-containing protein [Streptococcus suis]HEL2151161.1 helix-turn-helix domain-containing protein [Streptococcus suis]HEM5465126.1 helix-turn-helix domain-containing protein [Streptococcus suis]